MKRNILISALLLLIIFYSGKVLASVELFSFTTNSQVVLAGTLSKPITIQSQSVSGLPEPTTETFDLTFTSSSETGLFLGSTGKPVSKTMSKNSSNRTFYYKDSSTGSFTLTVTATSRDSKKSFTVIQNIVIAKEISKPNTVQKVSQSVSKNTEQVNKATSSEEVIVFEAPKNESFITKIFLFFKHLFVEE